MTPSKSRMRVVSMMDILVIADALNHLDLKA